jgi:hypothetical protein
VPEFHQLPPPEDAEVLEAVTLIAGRTQAMIARRGRRMNPARF